jgi:hypothetical protein
MDYIKTIIGTYMYKNNKLDYEFSKPSGYKNINSSSVVKK